jgi:integrase
MENYAKVPGEALLYQNPDTKVYFIRKQGEHGDTIESLLTTKKSAAVKARDDYRSSRRHPEWQPAPAQAKSVDTKKEVPQGETAGDILRYYAANGYQTEDGESRIGATLEDEKRNAAKLLEWWDAVPTSEIRRPKFLGYKEWRISAENRRKGLASSGLRSVDCDLKTLSNAFKYAIARDYYQDINPCSGRPKFCKDKDVSHCRDFMPDDADELHDAAEHFLKRPGSEACGFQLLIEAYSGLRCSEVLKWGTRQYGALTQDGQYRHVWRLKGQHAVNPYAQETDALAATVKALEEWRAKAHPDSKAWLPNDRGKQITKDALRRGLDRLSKAKDDDGKPLLKKPLRGHGAGRAFYVLVRRSWGKNDAEIAHELGHTSGGETIRTTYGGVPRNWGTKLPKLSWMPLHRKPAWESIVFPPDEQP